MLKKVNVTPVLKKKDRLCVENYRQVSILQTISKIFERVISEQVVTYFDPLFYCRLTAFRNGYSCVIVVRLVDDCRMALDRPVQGLRHAAWHFVSQTLCPQHVN